MWGVGICRIENLAQRLTLEQLGDPVRNPLVVPDVVDREHVCMVERPGCTCLLLEAPQAALIGRGRGAALGTVACRAAGGWRLNGRRVLISGGDLADADAVFAALESEVAAFWTGFLVEMGSLSQDVRPFGWWWWPTERPKIPSPTHSR